MVINISQLVFQLREDLQQKSQFNCIGTERKLEKVTEGGRQECDWLLLLMVVHEQTKKKAFVEQFICYRSSH